MHTVPSFVCPAITCIHQVNKIAINYLSGDILEIGVQWSVLKGDIESFQRYMAQLKPYYFDYRLVN